MNFFIFIIPIIPLIGWLLGVHKKEKWYTIPIKGRNWPPGYESWTYKRCMGQNLIWALFGNDNDGVVPWFKGKSWSFWKWWFRNRTHNYNWYIAGYSRWEEGNPDAHWDGSHLKYKILISSDPTPDPPNKNAHGLIVWFVKPKKMNWLWYRPYFRLNLTYFRAWWGWGKGGLKHSSIEFGRE